MFKNIQQLSDDVSEEIKKSSYQQRMAQKISKQKINRLEKRVEMLELEIKQIHQALHSLGIDKTTDK
jgi:uncharacterized protein (UPF0335 family)